MHVMHVMRFYTLLRMNTPSSGVTLSFFRSRYPDNDYHELAVIPGQPSDHVPSLFRAPDGETTPRHELRWGHLAFMRAFLRERGTTTEAMFKVRHCSVLVPLPKAKYPNGAGDD